MEFEAVVPTLWSSATKYNGINRNTLIALPSWVYDGTLTSWGAKP